MCGIAGFVGTTPPMAPAVLDSMVDALSHRGPDDRGTWLGDDVGLGMRRLSVIDVEGGSQPMTAGPWVLVLNGEIYNFRALRRTLEQRGHRFSSRSDTEVALRAILEWDVAAVERFDGMFAIAAWHRQERRLILARDRFGEKPLYLWPRGNGLAFASEPRAFRRLGPMPPLAPEAVGRYLTFGVVTGETSIWQGISRLRPDCRATWQDGHLSVVAINRRTPSVGSPGTDREQAVQGLRERLSHVVRDRLVADVPVGVLLSGGIDSSLVAAAAAEDHPGLHTFSVRVDDPARDESRWSRHVAKVLGTHHTEIDVTAADALVAVGELPEVFDEPFSDASAIPTLLLSKHVRAHVTVALSGEGGDEVFSGYAHQRRSAEPDPWAQRLPRHAGPLADWFAWQWWARPNHLWQTMARERGEPATRYTDIVARTPRGLRRRLGVPEWPLAPILGEADALIADTGPLWPLALDRRWLLADDLLTKVDRASMSVGLELRCPFLAPALVDWATTLPPAVLGKLGAKSIPRDLAAIHFGEELARRPKRGFSLPVARWLRGPLRDEADRACEGVLVRDGWLDAGSVHNLRRALDRRFDPAAAPLWAIAQFERWYEHWHEPGPLR